MILGLIMIVSFKRSFRVKSLLRSWAHQCPQRHQRSDRNVLVIDQMFLRERQRFHEGSRLVLGLRIHQKDDAFAIAARIPLADFPVEIKLHSCPNLFRYRGHDLLRVTPCLGVSMTTTPVVLGIGTLETPEATPDKI